MSNLLTRGYVLAAGSVLDPLYTALGWIMALLYSVIPSYGIAIILLTIVVRLALYPLTVKQTKSMQAMQRLQPEIKRLQAKYKNDRQKLNEEMMKFYKENKVNPLAGCLPLILQLPLFIVLYRLIHDLTTTLVAGAIVVGGATAGTAGQTLPAKPVYQHVKVADASIKTVKGQKLLNDTLTADVVDPADGKVVGQLRGKVIDGQLYDPGTKPKDNEKKPAAVFDLTGKTKIGTVDGAKVPAYDPPTTPDGAHVVANPKHIPEDSQLAKDLRQTPGQMEWLGMDLAKRPSQASGPEAIGLYLLVALTVITGYYQQRQMTARTPASAQNPQMQMMGKIFPLFFGFISLQIPAGVVLYFVVSNLWQIGQQAIIFRQQDREEAAKKGSGGGGKGGAIAASAVATAAPPKTPDNPSGSGSGNGGSGKGGSSESSGDGNPSASSANRPGSGGSSSNRNRRRKRRRRGR